MRLAAIFVTSKQASDEFSLLPSVNLLLYLRGCCGSVTHDCSPLRSNMGMFVRITMFSSAISHGKRPISKFAFIITT
jgi:hypothetical protein